MGNRFLRETHLRRMIIMLVISSVFFIAELVISQITHSQTLLVTSYQMLYNILSIIGCCTTIKMCQKKSDVSNTFGWARLEILSMALNIIFLAAVCFSLVVEAVQTLVHVEHGDAMHYPIWVLSCAGSGLIINVLCILLIGGYTHHQGSFLAITPQGNVTVNENATEEAVRRGLRRLNSNKCNSVNRQVPFPQPSSVPSTRRWPAFSSVFRDTAGLILVIITSSIVYVYGEDSTVSRLADPILAMVSVAILAITTYPFMIQAGEILLQITPDHIDVEELDANLRKVFPSLVNIHDIHVWALTPSRIICTAHMLFMDEKAYLKAKEPIEEFLAGQGISHVTLQPEFHKLLTPVPSKGCILDCVEESCSNRKCCPTGEPKEINNRNMDKESAVGQWRDCDEVAKLLPNVDQCQIDNKVNGEVSYEPPGRISLLVGSRTDITVDHLVGHHIDYQITDEVSHQSARRVSALIVSRSNAAVNDLIDDLGCNINESGNGSLQVIDLICLDIDPIGPSSAIALNDESDIQVGEPVAELTVIRIPEETDQRCTILGDERCNNRRSDSCSTDISVICDNFEVHYQVIDEVVNQPTSQTSDISEKEHNYIQNTIENESFEKDIQRDAVGEKQITDCQLEQVQTNVHEKKTDSAVEIEGIQHTEEIVATTGESRTPYDEKSNSELYYVQQKLNEKKDDSEDTEEDAVAQNETIAGIYNEDTQFQNGDESNGQLNYLPESVAEKKDDFEDVLENKIQTEEIVQPKENEEMQPEEGNKKGVDFEDLVANAVVQIKEISEIYNEQERETQSENEDESNTELNCEPESVAEKKDDSEDVLENKVQTEEIFQAKENEVMQPEDRNKKCIDFEDLVANVVVQIEEIAGIYSEQEIQSQNEDESITKLNYEPESVAEKDDSEDALENEVQAQEKKDDFEDVVDNGVARTKEIAENNDEGLSGNVVDEKFVSEHRVEMGTEQIVEAVDEKETKSNYGENRIDGDYKGFDEIQAESKIIVIKSEFNDAVVGEGGIETKTECNDISELDSWAGKPQPEQAIEQKIELIDLQEESSVNNQNDSETEMQFKIEVGLVFQDERCIDSIANKHSYEKVDNQITSEIEVQNSRAENESWAIVELERYVEPELEKIVRTEIEEEFITESDSELEVIDEDAEPQAEIVNKAEISAIWTDNKDFIAQSNSSVINANAQDFESTIPVISLIKHNEMIVDVQADRSTDSPKLLQVITNQLPGQVAPIEISNSVGTLSIDAPDPIDSVKQAVTERESSFALEAPAEHEIEIHMEASSDIESDSSTDVEPDYLAPNRNSYLFDNFDSDCECEKESCFCNACRTDSLAVIDDSDDQLFYSTEELRENMKTP